MIPPLIPPSGHFSPPVPGHRSTPAAHSGDGDVVYGLSTIGEGGRISDRHLLRALDWAPGTCLDIHPHQQLLIIHPISETGTRVTRDGYFRVPYRQRRKVCLFIGDRVLLVGRRSRRRLIVHPPGVLDDLMTTSLGLLDQPS